MAKKRGGFGIGRREFAKSIAAGTATVGLSGLAAATDETTTDERFRSRIERSHEIKRQGGSVEQWHQALETAGLDVGRRTPGTAMAPGEVDGLTETKDGSKEREGILEQDDVDLDLTLVTAAETDMYYAELSWSYDLDRWREDTASRALGNGPKDAAAIAYNNNWWRLADDSISASVSTSEFVEYADESFSGSGPGFKVDDVTLAGDRTIDRTSWCGVFLKPVGDYGADERRVFAEYVHTWTGLKTSAIISVGITWPPSPTVLVSAQPETKKWHTSTEANGATILRAMQSDAASISTATDGGLLDGDEQITPGDVVKTTERTYVRADGQVGDNVIQTVSPGYQAHVAGGPTVSDRGFVWWQVECLLDDREEPTLVWLRNDHLELHRHVESAFDHGDRVKTVSPDSSPMMLRSKLGWHYRRMQLPSDIYGTVQKGPQRHDESTWWRVDFPWVEKQREDDMPRGRGGLRGVGSGWVRQKHLVSAPARFDHDQRVKTAADGSDVVGVRKHLGHDAAIRSTVPATDALGFVIAGPERAADEDWYYVEFNAGQEGWLPASWLADASRTAGGRLTDLDSYKFESEIRTLVEDGVVSGYSDDTFRPNRTLTRAEYVTMVNQAFDLHPQQREGFTDIDGHWAESHIRTVGATDFISGYRDGSFRPDREITTAEVITSLASGLHYSGGNPRKLQAVYSDAHEIPAWARQAFADAHYTWGGIESVPDDEYLDPADDATRGEAAKYVYDASH